MKISAIIITRNEENNIFACLESLNFAEEIIVVDSGSTDRTADICSANPKVRFHVCPWEGFGIQKNRALDLATGEWIFTIDADESVTAELAAEILRILQKPTCDGYTVQRKNFYQGQWVKHSGWWPDPVLRLFRKDRGAFSNRPVHEKVVLDGQLGHLTGCLEHHSFHCVSDFMRKADSYSSLGAQLMHQQGKRSSVFVALLKSSCTFFKTLVLKKGFLDGYTGLLIASSNAVGVFYRIMKCIELKQGNNDSR